MGTSEHPSSVHDLAAARYVLLTTFTRDGRPKPTPVWAAPDGDALVVYTEASAWKLRRARNRPDVLLAACDMRGRRRGDDVPASAVVVEDPALVARVEAALQRKYGWQMRLARAVERLRGRRWAGVVLRDVPPPL